MHVPAGTLVGDEACVTAAVSIRNRATEHVPDKRPLVVVQTLGSDECHLYPDVVQPNAFQEDAGMPSARRRSFDLI